jgi:hypothetical protein
VKWQINLVGLILQHKIKLFFIVSGLLVFIPRFSKAQSGSSKGDTVEITETDFTRLPSFNGAHATVFGIALGMGKADAMEKIKNYQYLKLKADPFNPKRFYIQEVSTDTGQVTLAYLKWPNYDSGLYQMIIYPPMAKYLRGQSSSIIGPESLDSSSTLYKTFLGKPSASPVTSNMPEIKSRTIMHYYPKYNIVIEEDQASGKSTYDLILTRKW